MRVPKAKLMKIGVFTLVCIAFTVLLGIKLANSRLFARSYELSAVFENASGVLTGDAVKIAGVDVGRVTGTEIRNEKAVVTFNVDEGVELPSDTQLGIRWRNVVGQRFIYLFPGSSSKMLEEGDVVPASQTSDVADIGEFLNRLGPILRAIDPEKANQFLDAMNTALQGNEANVRALLDSGAQLANDLSERDDQIASLIDNADKILAAYARQDENISSIIDNLDEVSGVLASRTGDINRLVTNFADVQTQLDHLLRESRSNIDASIDSLYTVADTLARNKKDLSRTLRTLPPGVAGYFQTTSWGEFFNVRIIQVLFQDSESNDLVQQGELPNQHGDSGGGAGGGGGDDNGGGGSGSPDSSGAPAHENVGSILRYVLTGDGS